MNIPQFRGRKYKPWPYEFHGARYWSEPPIRFIQPAWQNGQWKPDALSRQEMDIIRPRPTLFVSENGLDKGSRPWEESSGRQFQLFGGPKYYAPHRLSEHNMSTPSGYSHLENPHAEYYSHRLYSNRLNGPVQESVQQLPALTRSQLEQWGANSSLLPAGLTTNGQRRPGNSFHNFVNSEWIKT